MKREYPPTPAQIAEECRQIRAHRAAMHKPVAVEEGRWDRDDWRSDPWSDDEE